jgi:hypothetical protein
MSEEQLDRTLEEFLEVRQPGVDYEDHQHVEPLEIDVDLTNFKKFPRVDDSVTYKKAGRDHRADLADSGLDLPDYSGPFKADLKFTDFSCDALVNMLGMSHEYYALLIESWAVEVAARKGEEAKREIQTSVWANGVLPQVPRLREEWGSLDDVDTVPEDLAAGAVVFNPFKLDPRYAALDKEDLVKLTLGSHEFLLLVIECWAAEIVVRYGLDEMFDIQWALWSDKVLPEVRNIKGRWMNITTNDVAAFMKDIQVDATSFPGKAFELTFEMPEDDVGIMTFLKCCAADQWEALGRPDILEKNCHSTCPASLIETAKMYDPNMKVDILAIPPRVSSENVCCKWKLSMRSPDDPEFVPVELRRKPATG